MSMITLYTGPEVQGGTVRMNGVSTPVTENVTDEVFGYFTFFTGDEKAGIFRKEHKDYLTFYDEGTYYVSTVPKEEV